MSLESALKRDRWWVLLALSVAIALSWAWVLPMARDMYGTMQGPSAWMMTDAWTPGYVLLLLAMWIVMMAGMMLPSAAPAVLIYAAVVRRSYGERSAALLSYAFVGGYLLAWTGFSVAATALQWLLRKQLLLSPMMEVTGALPGGVLLLIAGAYQLTPAKRTCLDSCRSPATFITQHWHRGAGGAVRMGWLHGWYCVGCCWALMLLLFVGGVMNLVWIAAIAILVLIEKLAPWGLQSGRLSGVVLIALGAWTLARSLW